MAFKHIFKAEVLIFISEWDLWMRSVNEIINPPMGVSCYLDKKDYSELDTHILMILYYSEHSLIY